MSLKNMGKESNFVMHSFLLITKKNKSNKQKKFALTKHILILLSYISNFSEKR